MRQTSVAERYLDCMKIHNTECGATTPTVVQCNPQVCAFIPTLITGEPPLHRLRRLHSLRILVLAASILVFLGWCIRLLGDFAYLAWVIPKLKAIDSMVQRSYGNKCFTPLHLKPNQQTPLRNPRCSSLCDIEMVPARMNGLSR